MGQVTVTLNGRTFRLSCGPGEEPRLLLLAEHVKERIEALAAEFGHAGDDRLLLMAALLATDELFDARDQLMAMATAQPSVQTSAQSLADTEPENSLVAAPAAPQRPQMTPAPVMTAANLAPERRMPRPIAGQPTSGTARMPVPRQPPQAVES